MRTIPVAGGGYAGFYPAWKREGRIRRPLAAVQDPRRAFVTGRETPVLPVRFEHAESA